MIIIIKSGAILLAIENDSRFSVQKWKRHFDFDFFLLFLNCTQYSRVIYFLSLSYSENITSYTSTEKQSSSYCFPSDCNKKKFQFILYDVQNQLLNKRKWRKTG